MIHSEELHYYENHEALVQASQTSCCCPILGSVLGLANWGFKQPKVVVSVLLPNQRSWMWMNCKVFQNQNLSMIL